MGSVEAKVKWPGREEAQLRIDFDENGVILSGNVTGVGGPKFLQHLRRLRSQLKGRLADLPVPEGRSPEDMLFRELISRAKGDWTFPYGHEELCHCRAVPTAVVDLAICLGAHSPRRVSEETSASTACGTCRPDVEAILRFRLPDST